MTSWSSDDLRVKYRAEWEREEAYQAFRLEEQVAEALDQDYGQVILVALHFVPAASFPVSCMLHRSVYDLYPLLFCNSSSFQWPGALFRDV